MDLKALANVVIQRKDFVECGIVLPELAYKSLESIGSDPPPFKTAIVA
jgi:hypothetical protein